MLLLRGATTVAQNVALITLFQYMLLLRGATGRSVVTIRSPRFQYMLLLRGATLLVNRSSLLRADFNTCSSCEEQPVLPLPKEGEHSHFNTCSSCEEQQDPIQIGNSGFYISIHAPLVRSNFFVHVYRTNRDYFNTCSSCEEQHACRSAVRRDIGFNTCSSCEEQPYRKPLMSSPMPRFNTCSSCEEQRNFLCNRFTIYVSIHAPLARSNLYRDAKTKTARMFQYMLLLRGATPTLGYSPSNYEFQYMLLLRGATQKYSSGPEERNVSIHAPLARSNADRAGIRGDW